MKNPFAKTGRTQLTTNQIFHGRVEEKDREALALVAMFKKYRLVVERVRLFNNVCAYEW